MHAVHAVKQHEDKGNHTAKSPRLEGLVNASTQIHERAAPRCHEHFRVLGYPRGDDDE
jgi:hypothetical protein